MPLVSIVILNYRNALKTVRCVQELQKQTLIDQCEIIIVDNHSNTDSMGILRTRLRHIPRLRIIETSRNGGFGHGYNAGALHALGEYILINNPDKILEPSGIEKLYNTIKNDESIGIIAPKILHHDGTQRLSARRYPQPLDVVIKRVAFFQSWFPSRLRRYVLADLDLEKEQRVDWIVGGLLMIPRVLFHLLRGFDKRFFLFFEDVDLCRRCHELGKDVLYYPRVVAHDRKKRLSEGNVFTLLGTRVGRAHIASALKYFWKWKNSTKCEV